ncbi:MAG: HAD hydrolase-like protein [Bifidobacteriaceae bacterium]|jgi:phosphonatase-like hydrolase|nr:HAD hydrolase-like protein [Bifidobacteriaceae bacterium]
MNQPGQTTRPSPVIKPELVVLDLAGTTVSDSGLVIAAFRQAVAAVGIGPDHAALPGMLEHVQQTMGASKEAVFLELFEGDQQMAKEANQSFETAYAEAIEEGLCQPIDGAEQAITDFRQAGLKVALTTGFSPTTRRRLVRRLGWEGITDLGLSPADTGPLRRGRPYPDMILTAVLRLGISDVRAVATAGDTASDIRSGRAAGAGLVAGVLTGAHDNETLAAASSDAVFPSVREFAAEVLARLRWSGQSPM